jgi:hypothetical protein
MGDKRELRKEVKGLVSRENKIKGVILVPGHRDVKE